MIELRRISFQENGDALFKTANTVVERILQHVSDACFIYSDDPGEIFANWRFIQLFGDEIVDIHKLDINEFADILIRANIGVNKEEILSSLAGRGHYKHDFFLRTTKYSFYAGILVCTYTKTGRGGSSGYYVLLKNASLSDTPDDKAEFMESLFNSIPVPLFVKNREGEYILINKAYEAYTRISSDEVVGKTVYDLFPHDHARRYALEEDIMYTNRHARKYEFKMPHIDGTFHNAIISKDICYGKDGKPKGSVGALLDITDLRITERNLQYQINFSRILMEISSSFINLSPTDVDNMIDRSLQKIVTFVNVDDGFIFLLDDTESSVSLSHMFSKYNRKEVRALLQNLPLEKYPFFGNVIREKEELNIRSIDDFPFLTSNELTLFNKANILSMIAVPIFSNSIAIGYLGFSSKNHYRGWTRNESLLLRFAGEVFVSALERKKTVKALTAEEKKFRNIFEQSNNPVAIIDGDYRILLANPRFHHEFSGRKDESFLGQNILNIFDIRSKKKFLNIKQQLVNEEVVISGEFTTRKTWQGVRRVEIKFKFIEFQERMAILVMITDLTERMELEKKLLETIMRTEEKERQRFAEDLHDELGPMLSGIKLYISELGEQIPRRDNSKALIVYLEEMVDEAVSKIRTVSNNLMPRLLLEYGLERGLNSFINKINSLHLLQIHMAFTGHGNKISSIQEIVIYRMIIELINNSMKHSKASQINIVIKVHIKNIKITYRDNGVGFDLFNEIKMKEGIGLTSLLNRLATVYGQYKFSSRKNQGIRFEFNIPSNI